MRETKFRGKHLDNGKWVYGYFFKSWEQCFILWGMENNIPCMIEVDPKTVGQYTGIKDKNGMGLTEVYEGDIISEDGTLKGNIYENDKRETDIVVPQLGTKTWEATYKEIVARGYGYSK